MQGQHSVNKLFLAFSALLIAVLLTPFCFAQNPAPTPQTYLVTVVHVKPDMDLEYRELIKEAAAAYKKGGGKEWQTWTTALLGNAFEYWIFRPVENIKQFDSPGPMVKGLGEEGMRALTVKRNRMIVSTRTFLATTIPTLSVAPKSAPKLCIGVITDLTPGRWEDYGKWLRENALTANAKTDSKGVITWAEGLGGNPNTAHVAVFFDNFEDIGNFVQAYNKALADLKLQPNPPAGIQSQVEFAVYRHVPELSFAPAPAVKAETK